MTIHRRSLKVKWMYWKLYRYLDIESILWNITDFVRSRRVKLAERMKPFITKE
jgi:hypothetical protein